MKGERQQRILQIVQEKVIQTQDELAEALRAAGFEVTQATVSRDIRELGLIKVAAGDGTYRYAVPPQPLGHEALKRVRRAFQEYVVAVDHSGYLLVVKTLPGTAHAVAAALDALRLEDIVGTVAGDDCIVVITRMGPRQPPPRPVRQLLERFAAWREGRE